MDAGRKIQTRFSGIFQVIHWALVATVAGAIHARIGLAAARLVHGLAAVLAAAVGGAANRVARRGPPLSSCHVIILRRATCMCHTLKAHVLETLRGCRNCKETPDTGSHMSQLDTPWHPGN